MPTTSIPPLSDLLAEAVTFITKAPKAGRPIAERGPSPASQFLTFAKDLIIQGQAVGVDLPFRLLFDKWLAVPGVIESCFTKDGVIAKTPVATVNRDLSLSAKVNQLPAGWTYIPAKLAHRSDTVKAVVILRYDQPIDA